MTEKYNALDNLKAVYELRTQLILEQADLRASQEYEAAVDNYWDDDREKEIEAIQTLISACTGYIGERLL